MNPAQIQSELQYKAVRSSGAGGQNVNKVATKIQLIFHLPSSQGLTEVEKSILLEKLSNRISSEGFLQIDSDATRSQLRNKELALKRLFDLLELLIKPEKARIPTKISRAAKKKRLDNKRLHALKKANRKLNY